MDPIIITVQIVDDQINLPIDLIHDADLQTVSLACNSLQLFLQHNNAHQINTKVQGAVNLYKIKMTVT